MLLSERELAEVGELTESKAAVTTHVGARVLAEVAEREQLAVVMRTGSFVFFWHWFGSSGEKYMVAKEQNDAGVQEPIALKQLRMHEVRGLRRAGIRLLLCASCSP